jgi:hypothetical protein
VSVTASCVWSKRNLSTDHPYRFARENGAQRFLEEDDLSVADKTAVANGNWQWMVDGIWR